MCYKNKFVRGKVKKTYRKINRNGSVSILTAIKRFMVSVLSTIELPQLLSRLSPRSTSCSDFVIQSSDSMASINSVKVLSTCSGAILIASKSALRRLEK